MRKKKCFVNCLTREVKVVGFIFIWKVRSYFVPELKALKNELFEKKTPRGIVKSIVYFLIIP